MEPPWDRGTKDCSNDPGHMIKMAAMPIYGKNLTKSSSLEPKVFVCSIGCTGTTKFIQMMTLGWPWPILLPYAFVWEKGKTMDISETIVVYDVKSW